MCIGNIHILHGPGQAQAGLWALGGCKGPGPVAVHGPGPGPCKICIFPATPPQNHPKARFVAIYGRMAGSDGWKTLLWIFQDFNFDILKS